MASPRKRFGQHFLTSRTILDRIAAAVDPAPQGPVLEIGPGKGTLTEALLRRGAAVTAVEIDRDLAAALELRLPGIRVVQGDALALEWPALMGDAPFDVVGNIPYNVTSPLIEKALTPPRPRRVVFLVQKEVADRISAAPGGREYGALTVGVHAVARAKRLFTVPAGAFHPPPKVHSALVRLEPLEHPLVADDEVLPFRRFVTGVFGFRRKQMARALRELTGWSAARVTPALAAAGITPTVRPETVGPPTFVALFHRLVDGGWVPD